MTSSSRSNQSPLRLILIHGMNNNQECFYPLRDALAAQGFDVAMLVLPNHGQVRDEHRNLDSAMEKFDRDLTPLVQDHYVVVAFSQGAQYFQLWLSRYQKTKPKAMVLLAPAVFINFLGLVEKLVHLLPETKTFKSKMPKIFRRYDELYFWEYRLLFKGVEEFARMRNLYSIPTLVMIDLKDELVNAKEVVSLYQQMGAAVNVIKRKNLRFTLGRHHIIFHPDYFQADEWSDFIQDLAGHLSDEA